MKICVYEIAGFQQEYLKQKLEGLDVEFYPFAFSEHEKPNPEAEIVCTFTSSPVNAQTLPLLPKLKYVATRTTGFDHLDLKLLTEKGILASNVPTYGENTVAEFAFALLLTLSRKMYPAVKRIREQGKFNFDGLLGFDLMGKTIGIIGTGHIGMFMVKISKGFGMNVVAYDPYPKADAAKEHGFTYVSLEELLKTSDIITLHVPYMPATHHILNKENLATVKNGAVLINTARGPLVETEGLIWALKNGKLAGAALDVLEEEGFIKDEYAHIYEGHPNEKEMRDVLATHELMYMENVIITPHNAFQTTEAIYRILDTTADNIRSYISGTPKNIIK